MKKVELVEVLKKNFHVKKIKNLAVAGKKESPVLVQDSNGKWVNSGVTATIPDGKKVHRYRINDNKLEFTFLGDSVEFLNSCICTRAYMYENKIILPQGLGGGYVILTI